MGRCGPFAVRQANHPPRPAYCQRWCGPWPTASLQSAKTRDTEIHPAKTLYVSIYCVCASGIADTGLTQPASSQHGGIDGMNLRSRGQMVNQHARHPDAAGQGDTIENAPLTDFPPLATLGLRPPCAEKSSQAPFPAQGDFANFTDTESRQPPSVAPNNLLGSRLRRRERAEHHCRRNIFPGPHLTGAIRGN